MTATAIPTTLGIGVDHWGTGVARDTHDAVLVRMNAAGTTRAWLRFFTGNERGRRFYERQGWQRTDERSRSTFPPYPELRRYERVLAHTENGASEKTLSPAARR